MTIFAGWPGFTTRRAYVDDHAPEKKLIHDKRKHRREIR